MTFDKLVVPDDLAAWLQSRAPLSAEGTQEGALLDALALAKSIAEAGTRERDRALALTADDLRRLADS